MNDEHDNVQIQIAFKNGSVAQISYSAAGDPSSVYLSQAPSDPEVAVTRVSEERFDAVIVDFEDLESATMVLANVGQPGTKMRCVTVALVDDPAKIRHSFGAGANFVLSKPISPEQATATLRAASALLKRERRRSFRVPVQTPVVLTAAEGHEIEGIMLDLSATGMDVLSAQPLSSASHIGFCFTLPDGSAEVNAHGEVAWASPNGQTGVRFLDIPEDVQTSLQNWLIAHSTDALPDEADPVSHCGNRIAIPCRRRSRSLLAGRRHGNSRGRISASYASFLRHGH